jgi:hypothetical protein
MTLLSMKADISRRRGEEERWPTYIKCPQLSAQPRLDVTVMNAKKTLRMQVICVHHARLLCAEAYNLHDLCF